MSKELLLVESLARVLGHDALQLARDKVPVAIRVNILEQRLDRGLVALYDAALACFFRTHQQLLKLLDDARHCLLGVIEAFADVG